MTQHSHPILYSFRRCPYAMRARMGIFASGINVELREIVLRDKPDHMLKISPKGTVPVLLLLDETVIDESLDIMLWALGQRDIDGLFNAQSDALNLIKTNDTKFKYALDRYKYPNRYLTDEMPVFEEDMRQVGLKILKDWNARIEEFGQLLGPEISLADIAIFPFVRQFAHVDLEWFEAQDIKPLVTWLNAHKESDLYQAIMPKFPLWEDSQEPLIFPSA